MPITRLRTRPDPYAPLAWNTSVVVLALEKLKKKQDISIDELDALKSVAENMDRLSQAGDSLAEAKSETLPYVPPHLRKSYFTLVAMREKNAPQLKPLEFKRTGEELHLILSNCEAPERSRSLDPQILESAQRVCLELLERLNNQRPGITAR